MKQDKPISELSDEELHCVLEKIRDERRARTVVRREQTMKLKGRKEEKAKNSKILDLVLELKKLKEQMKEEREEREEQT